MSKETRLGLNRYGGRGVVTTLMTPIVGAVVAFNPDVEVGNTNFFGSDFDMGEARFALVQNPLPDESVRIDNRNIVIADVPGSSFLENEVGLDNLTIKLEKYLKSYNSPLAAYARSFVEAGRSYGVIPELLVAISGEESNFGTKGNPQLNNPFGISGEQEESVKKFESYDEAINFLAKLLGQGKAYESFRKTGSIGVLSRIYCPVNQVEWASAVSFFKTEVENTTN